MSFRSSLPSLLLRTVAILMVVAACGSPDHTLAPTAESAISRVAPVSVSVASSAVSEHGEVAVALRATADAPVSGLQVELTYDTATISYVGVQVAERPSAVVQVHAEAGLLRIASAAPRGVLSTDAIVLRFTARQAGALASLKIRQEASSAVVGAGEERPVRVRSSALIVDAALNLRDPEDLDPSAWAARLGLRPDVDGARLSLPTGRFYGDANGTGTITVGDLVLALNFVVGNLTPTPEQFEAANVAPVNTADGVAVALPDPCRPGRSCTGGAPFSETGPGALTVADAVLIAQRAVGADVPVVGRSISAPAGTVRGVVSSPLRGPLSGITVSLLDGPATTTGAGGAFISPLTRAGAATLILGALPSGCSSPGPQSVTIEADQQATLDISVECTIALPPPLRVSAGDAHMCVLSSENNAYCTGLNFLGRLGTGDTVSSLSLVPVDAPSGVTFTELAAGVGHTCAVASSGDAYCWGDNAIGQLADGTNLTRLIPTRVVAPAGVRFARIVSDYDHTCGVTTTGEAYCWGWSSSGQLGDGSTASAVTARRVTAPTGVAFAQVATGETHSCGLSDDGEIFCWGGNLEGQLGDGTSVPRSLPTRIAVASNVRFSRVGAGFTYSCGLSVDGTMYCWGQGVASEAAIGITRVPTRIPMPSGVTLAQLAVGTYGVCGIATTGESYCLSRGASGLPGSEPFVVPALVQWPTGIAFSAISIGGGFRCGLTGTPELYCWGENDAGQLGDGTRTRRESPVQINLPAGATF